jgi:hypothetical protein
LSKTDQSWSCGLGQKRPGQEIFRLCPMGIGLGKSQWRLGERSKRTEDPVSISCISKIRARKRILQHRSKRWINGPVLDIDCCCSHKGRQPGDIHLLQPSWCTGSRDTGTPKGQMA